MNIKLYTLDGWHYLGVEFKGKILLISIKGKVGDCISP